MSMEPETNEPEVSVQAESPNTEPAASESPAPEKHGFDAAAILAILCGIGILAAIVIALVGHTGSYALKVNNTEYSAAEVNYEYMSVFQQYSQYSSYFGSVLPDDPYTMDEEGEYETWGDFYMDQTKEKLKQLTSLCDMAERDGVTLTDEDTAEIDTWIDQLKSSATSLGKDDFDAFLAENFGEGVTEQVLRDMATRETLAMKYVEYYQENFSVSDDQIDAEYEQNKDAYDTYHFRYCLVEAMGEVTEGTGEPTEEALAAAETKANMILDAVKEGDGDKAELFAEKAETLSLKVESTAMDGDSMTQYQVPFESWIKDADRAAGDMTVAEQPGYGYFVILFEGRERSDEPTVNVRHILIQGEDADGDGTVSDAELAAAKAEIERINAEWEAGEQTEEAFAALANQYSADPGSNTNGGLYENVYEGQMVPEFNDFCFDDSRKAGDVEIIADEQYSGYHLMYFVGTGEPYTNQVIRDKLVSEAMEAFAKTLTEDVNVVEGKDFEAVGLTQAYLDTLKSSNTQTTTP